MLLNLRSWLFGIILSFSIIFPSYADFIAPVYTVNLDESAETRWNDVIISTLELRGWEYSFAPIVAFIEDLISPEFFSKYEKEFQAIADQMDYKDEIQGIYNTLVQQGYGDKIQFGELVSLNLIYELTCFCTSIVAENSDTTIYHGRNLDYGIPGLQNITAQVQFVKNNEVIIDSVMFLGYVGILTGQTKSVSVSIDQMEYVNATTTRENIKGFLKNIVTATFLNGKSIGTMIRETLETQGSFGDSVTLFSKTPLISPCFLIVAGVNSDEGCVITRNRLGPNEQVGEGVWMIDFPTYWYRVETNYVHWEAPPESDNRLDPAMDAMDSVGVTNIDADTMMDVMSTVPVFNSDTVYTAVMSPKLQTFNVVVRVGDF